MTRSVDDGQERARKVRLVKVGLPYLVALIVVRTFSIKVLWNWFAPHALSSARPINIATAFVLELAYLLFRGFRRGGETPDEREAVAGLKLNIFASLMLVLAAFIVHYFLL